MSYAPTPGTTGECTSMLPISKKCAFCKFYKLRVDIIKVSRVCQICCKFWRTFPSNSSSWTNVSDFQIQPAIHLPIISSSKSHPGDIANSLFDGDRSWRYWALFVFVAEVQTHVAIVIKSASATWIKYHAMKHAATSQCYPAYVPPLYHSSSILPLRLFNFPCPTAALSSNTPSHHRFLFTSPSTCWQTHAVLALEVVVLHQCVPSSHAARRFECRRSGVCLTMIINEQYKNEVGAFIM